MEAIDFSQFQHPFGVDIGKDDSDPIKIYDMTGKVVLSGVPLDAAHAFVRSLNGHDKEINALLKTYRAIWSRLPKSMREQQLAMMREWAPAHYERLTNDLTSMGKSYGEL